MRVCVYECEWYVDLWMMMMMNGGSHSRRRKCEITVCNIWKCTLSLVINRLPVRGKTETNRNCDQTIWRYTTLSSFLSMTHSPHSRTLDKFTNVRIRKLVCDRSSCHSPAYFYSDPPEIFVWHVREQHVRMMHKAEWFDHYKCHHRNLSVRQWSVMKLTILAHQTKQHCFRPSLCYARWLVEQMTRFYGERFKIILNHTRNGQFWIKTMNQWFQHHECHDAFFTESIRVLCQFHSLFVVFIHQSN